MTLLLLSFKVAILAVGLFLTAKAWKAGMFLRAIGILILTLAILALL